VRPLAGAWLSTRSAVGLSTALAVAAGVVAVIVVARRSNASRLTAAATIAAVCGAALGAIARWSALGDLDSRSGLLVLVPLGSVVLVAAATCVTGARTVRTRVEVRRLVERLSGSPTSVSNVAPVRSVQFAMPDGRWVDTDGRAVDDPPTDGLVINDESGPAVRLVVAVRTDPTDVVAALTPATRLALRNAQLSAIARARVADVQASRRRVVAASDGERQRIERDLHDGAQQRLVSASLHLRAAIGRADPPGAAALTRADATTRAALARLRDIAHGIFPSVLATEGLGAALEGLVGASSVTARLRVSGDIEVDAETAMAAYATVAAALDAHSEVDSTAAEVSVVRLDGTMTVTVASDRTVAESFDFTDIADRVGAARGELTVTSDADHTTVTAVLPCGS
jgi:signal transduction histidine kinase